MTSTTTPRPIPPSASCAACPACGKEEHEIYSQLGMACMLRVAASLATCETDCGHVPPPATTTPSASS